ncbi:MAG: hypothetical protein ABJA37_06690 [Ferruginibacter sp.]
MTFSKPYKQIIAGLLLLLYTFIVTPVQYWHHHNYAPSVKTSTAFKQQTSFEKNAGLTAEGNCSICSHQYSVYNEAATASFKIGLPIILYNYSTYIASIPKKLCLHSSNKGPPTLG